MSGANAKSGSARAAMTLECLDSSPQRRIPDSRACVRGARRIHERCPRCRHRERRPGQGESTAGRLVALSRFRGMREATVPCGDHGDPDGDQGEGIESPRLRRHQLRSRTSSSITCLTACECAAGCSSGGSRGVIPMSGDDRHGLGPISPRQETCVRRRRVSDARSAPASW